MSKYYALSAIKHGGQRYFRGDELPDLTRDQVKALDGIVSTQPPVGEDAKVKGKSRGGKL